MKWSAGSQNAERPEMSSDTQARSGRPHSHRRNAPLAVARVLILAMLLSVLLAADAPERGASRPYSPSPVGWPIRAAFYYPWFPESEHWATRYTPRLVN